MKIILQRVSSSSVKVENKLIAESNRLGLLALIGFGKLDDKDKINLALEKIINLRIFSNEKGKFDLSLLDINGDLTLVPQFTLFADTSKGRRPEFFDAMNPSDASILFDELSIAAETKLGKDKIQKGQFGKDMKVSLTNDGPVTIILDI